MFARSGEPFPARSRASFRCPAPRIPTGRSGTLDWNAIEEDERSVLYEWTLKGATGQDDQGGLARLIQGKDALHRVAYAYKTLPLAPERRENRLALLRDARVVQGEEEAQAAVEEFMPEPREERASP